MRGGSRLACFGWWIVLSCLAARTWATRTLGEESPDNAEHNDNNSTTNNLSKRQSKAAPKKGNKSNGKHGMLNRQVLLDLTKALETLEDKMFDEAAESAMEKEKLKRQVRGTGEDALSKILALEDGKVTLEAGKLDEQAQSGKITPIFANFPVWDYLVRMLEAHHDRVYIITETEEQFQEALKIRNRLFDMGANEDDIAITEAKVPYGFNAKSPVVQNALAEFKDSLIQITGQSRFPIILYQGIPIFQKLEDIDIIIADAESKPDPDVQPGTDYEGLCGVDGAKTVDTETGTPSNCEDPNSAASGNRTRSTSKSTVPSLDDGKADDIFDNLTEAPAAVAAETDQDLEEAARVEKFIRTEATRSETKCDYPTFLRMALGTHPRELYDKLVEKYIMVIFGSSTCGYCDLVKEDMALLDPTKRTWRFVNVMDPEDSKELYTRFVPSQAKAHHFNEYVRKRTDAKGIPIVVVNRKPCGGYWDVSVALALTWPKETEMNEYFSYERHKRADIPAYVATHEKRRGMCGFGLETFPHFYATLLFHAELRRRQQKERNVSETSCRQSVCTTIPLPIRRLGDDPIQVPQVAKDKKKKRDEKENERKLNKIREKRQKEL